MNQTLHVAATLWFVPTSRADIGLSAASRQRGLCLITGIRRNMKNYLMPMADKIMSRKRFLIETVRNAFKSEMKFERSRHGSVVKAMVHVLSCLVTYAFRPGKPSTSFKGKQIEAYP